MSDQKKLLEVLGKMDKKLGFLIGEKIREKHNLIKNQVADLSNLTKDYNEIAFMLNITPSHAAKELSKLKRGLKDE